MNVLNLIGDIWWNEKNLYLIETNVDNFIWSDPDFGGDNTLRKFDGTMSDFMKEHGTRGRDKGRHIIGSYVAKNVIVQL